MADPGRRPWWPAPPLLFLLLLAPAARALAAEPGFRILADRTLPETLEQATDVRWASADSIYLAVLRTGGVELSLDSPTGEFRQVTPGRGDGDGIGLTGRVAASKKYLAVASGVFLLGWKAHGDAPRLDGRASFEFIEDVDVFENRLAVLGIRRGEDGELAPDGGIAWLGSLDIGLSDLEPIAFSASRRGSQPLDRCGTFEIGAVRFLPDGALAVVPGAEPGVFLYDAGGELIYTWETEPLGLDVKCDFADEQRDLLAGNLLARWAWLNQFRTVEDILPTADGVGLVIRRVTEDGTRWDLTNLRRDSAPTTTTLPVTSPSSTAHMRIDARGDRLVFLIYDAALVLPPGPKQAAAAPTRIALAERTR